MRVRSLVVVVFVFVLVAAVAGCDLFGIRCDADSDCPPEQEFCNLGLCSTVDGPVRAEGEGEEGEGEGCDDDADCGDAFCYDVDSGNAQYVAARDHTCVPAAADAATCPEAGLFTHTPDPSTPVIFSATAHETNTCFTEIEIPFFAPEGNGFTEFAVVFISGPGASSPVEQTAQVELTDQTAGLLKVNDTTCYSGATHLAISVGTSSLPTSNVVCAPFTSEFAP